MSLVEIILLAVALSIDACVVSFTYGLVIEKKKRLNSLLLALSTGFFQFAMPILGYYFVSLLHKYIEAFACYIVFAIFTYLGVKFIKEAFEEDKNAPVCLGVCCLFMIAVATSIDAFAAGVSIRLCEAPLMFSAVLIGAVTFVNSLLGFWGGFVLKKFPPRYLEIIAGMILIGLGVKALF